MNWELPQSVEVQGASYPIRTDYRCILDILTDLSDPEADEQERALAVLIGLYPDFDDMPPEHYEDALNEGVRFINCDSGDAPHKSPRLVDWTFLAAYNEIGDCTLAQVVRIRDHLARGKQLDKSDREWYRKNRHLVDFKRKYTSADDALMKEWGGT